MIRLLVKKVNMSHYGVVPFPFNMLMLVNNFFSQNLNKQQKDVIDVVIF